MLVAIALLLLAGAADGPRASSGHWALQPLRRVEPPPASGSPQPIDAFINEKLKEKGLAPAPPADRRTLIRRATFDLTGLPPAPEEVDAFVRDRSPLAFEKVVERLLASPRYGERWGRHWLDVVRYADSDGYSNDYERPNAWRYRDYVIRSFNQDKPYDLFITEQIAGDELDPSSVDNLVAAGFLRMGPWEHTAMSVAAVTRQLFLDDVTHNTATVFLGLTLGCARCHDHKFDPIPTRDYYRFQAVFASTQFEQRPAPFLAAEQRVEFERELARLQELIRRTEAKPKELREKRKGQPGYAATVEGQDLRSIDEGAAADLERDRAYRKRLEIYRRELDRYRPLAYSVSSGGLNPTAPKAGAAGTRQQEKQAAPETHILVGGALSAPGDKVAPGVLSAVSPNGAGAIPQAAEGRRVALARWIAGEASALAARVMVNRIWQYHFGRGLVATSNNFGLLGERPSHPELLDWLAQAFIQNGWSVKQMHRAIMHSAAYRRASRHPVPDAAAKADPGNRLLSYFSPRRMEAEELRDSILAVAGELSPDAGGPGTFPEINDDLAAQPILIMGTIAPAYQPSPTRRERNRRTVYTFQKRSLVNPIVEAFNGPGLNESCERREASIVPTQAFAAFNSKFAHDMSRAFALRLSKLPGGRAARVNQAFRLAFNRLPTAWERRRALAHLDQMAEYHRRAGAPAAERRRPLMRSLIGEYTGKHFDLEEETNPVEYEENAQAAHLAPEARALADLALVLFNSNEFVYIY